MHGMSIPAAFPSGGPPRPSTPRGPRGASGLRKRGSCSASRSPNGPPKPRAEARPDDRGRAPLPGPSLGQPSPGRKGPPAGRAAFSVALRVSSPQSIASPGWFGVRGKITGELVLVEARG